MNNDIEKLINEEVQAYEDGLYSKFGDAYNRLHRFAEEVERVATDDKPIHDLWMCEQDMVVLRPGLLYRFSVNPDCEKCKALNAPYEALSSGS